jgi:hypothetical protein
MWAIVVLVALNLGLMGLLWYQRLGPPRHPIPPAEQRGTGEFLARELGLDADGADKLRDLQDAHFRRADSLQRKMKDLNRAMFEQIFTCEPDSVRIRALSDSIGVFRAEFERMVVAHFEEVKQLCAPGRYERLRRMIFDALDRPSRLQDGAPPRRSPR